jgi:uncharacterized membrane protein YbhN (UPF0104 family)
VEPETRKQRRRRRIGVVVAVAVTGALGLLLDWPEVRRVLGQADWTVSPLALLCTSVSYGCLSYGFAVLSAIFGIRMERRRVASPFPTAAGRGRASWSPSASSQSLSITSSPAGSPGIRSASC